MVISFLLCLAGFFVIGILSITKNRHTTADYLVTSHSTTPSIVALSAVATNNSGYMFIGMIGYTVSVGLASIWLMIGWILGDFVVSFIVHRKMRQLSEAKQQVSYAGVLASMVPGEGLWLRRLGGLVTVVFLSVYAASQLAAGGKSLQAVLNWDYIAGAMIGAVVVVAYCFVGGIRASFWTDVAQSVVMIVAMSCLLVAGLAHVNGWTGFISGLESLEPEYLYWFSPSLQSWWSVGLFVAGWFLAGVAVVGQPHIMLRFLALDKPRHLTRVRLYYYSWYILFYGMTIGVGMLARLILPDVMALDPELALPKMAIFLLPAPFAGLVLAGLFAATMSTADSQIMACSASLTHDFRQRFSPSYWFVKGTTLAIATFSLVLALWGPRNVFKLVLISWGALGSAFAPLAVFAAFDKKGKIQEPTAVAMICAGLAGAICGRLWMPEVYEILPGCVASCTIYFVGLVMGHFTRAIKVRAGRGRDAYENS